MTYFSFIQTIHLFYYYDSIFKKTTKNIMKNHTKKTKVLSAKNTKREDQQEMIKLLKKRNEELLKEFSKRYSVNLP